MATYSNTCPLSQKQLIEKYFMEHRTKILDIAAFLDRLDRSVDANAEDDFRYTSFRQALEVLIRAEPGRVEDIQMILSDRSIELLEERDQQSAYGAYNPKQRRG